MKKTLFFLAFVMTFGLAASAQINTFPWIETFEDGAIPTDFTLVDNDGDGDVWAISGGSSGIITHSGVYCATSASWNSTSGPLTPDNWMITPAIAIPTDIDPDFRLSWWACGQDPSYAAEKYSVYIATGNTVDDFTATTAVYTGICTGEMVRQVVNLSAYAGQTIYVAFRHHDITDMFRINIDDIRIGGPEPPELSMTGSSLVALGATATYVATTDASTIAWFVDGTEQTGATGTTFTTTFSTTGNHTVRVDAINAAGTTSASVVTSVYDPATAVTRTSLLEHFTTGQCQWCPSGHQRLEQAMNGFEDRICWVAHHVGFGTDNFTISESSSLLGLYGASGTWAPAMTLDRNADNAIEAEADGVVGSVGDVNDLVSVFNAATNAPAFVTISLNNVSYDAQSRVMSVTVSGEFSADFTGTEPRLSLYLTQDGLVGRQADYYAGGYIEDYVHNHVIRASLTNIWGDASAFTSTTAGSTYSKTYSYTLPTNFNAQYCRLVAFVNDYGPDMLHRTVCNAAKTGYLLNGADPTTGIGDVESSINVVTYPNPATEMVYVTVEGQIRSYEMIDAMGRVVMAGENVNADILELNVNGLAQGLYIVNVTTDRGVAAQRVNVVK